MTVVARRPLMLKEYLQLDDDDSDNTAASGLAGATTVRCLLDAELRCAGECPLPKERPGKKALTKFSAAINAVKLLPFSPALEGSLPRCFSERLRGSFWGKKRWKKQKKKKNEGAAAAEQQRGEGWRSLRFPSPVASSRSSWSETEYSSGSDFLPASMASSESPHRSKKTAAGGEESDEEAVDSGPAKESESKVVEESAECSSSAEEKEQLSPVSVIDYPFRQGHGEDDENNIDEEVDSTSAPSPAFYRSLGNIERTKEQLMNRIRRFEMLAGAQLDPADLEECSPSVESTDHVASSDDEEEVKARDLLGELKSRPRGGVEKLLLDLIQEQSRARDPHRRAGAETAEMLSTARDWINGKRCGEVDDDCGEAALREMERNGRWRCFYEEEEDLAVYLEGSLLESLLEEIVQDLTECKYKITL